METTYPQISQRKRNEISQKWFVSKLKNSGANIVMKYTQQGTEGYFTIGKYYFDSIRGLSIVAPLENMNKLSYSEILNLI